MSFAQGAQSYADFTERVLANQRSLAASLKHMYSVIICGAGSAGSVLARRMAENPTVNVLLLEAGGSDDVAAVMEPALWPTNLGSERDWGFVAQPNPLLDGRAMSASMGKVLGGGSSINVMGWARGHKNDWDLFAYESGNSAWSYDAVLDVYRRIEDWRGTPDPQFRGTGGEAYVAPASDPHPLAHATLEGARSVGIATFPDANGRINESDGGAAIGDLCIRDGKRASMFRSYTFPYMDRPNLTVLTQSVVHRITLDGHRATGVEFWYDGQLHRVKSESDVVLCLGAIHTPKC